ncbi:MAG: DUF1641 domain-containing protein [Sulfolobales archaeon]|nr:DUF1641 domain-containing protein [Sulfolobales archaeon]
MAAQELDLDKLLSEDNLSRLAKMVEALPALEKLSNLLTQLDKSGKLDSLLNLMQQGLDLLDAVQRAELVDAVIEFSMDQLPKVQAVWPLLEKLTSEDVLTRLQKLDVDGMVRMLDSLVKLQESGAMQKLVELANVMADKDLVEALSTMITKTAPALKEWAKELPQTKPQGLVGITMSLNDPDVKFAMTAMISLLKKIGRALRSQ